MRVSRKCYNSKFFHVMIQGIRREEIFMDNYLKHVFVNYMKEAARMYDTRIVAYCVMNNHAHVLVYVKDIRCLTKMMHSLNTRYAMKYNKCLDRCGFVFRDRYRCENIHNRTYLKNCIRYIHNNPVKGKLCQTQSEYQYSSYKDYVSGKIGMSLINKIFGNNAEYILELNKPVESGNLFIDSENEFGNIVQVPPEKVIRDFYLENEIEPQHITEVELTRLIKLLMNKCGLTQIKIGQLLEMDRNKIYRLLKKLG